MIGSLAATTASAEAGRRKGYFVSIDGTNPAMLDTLLAKNILRSKFGYKWLHQQGAAVDRAMPGLISITAPSHVSTITCTPPSRHGIVGNSFFVNGENVNGFGHEFKTEPLWISAKRDGKKVLALGYVGADGSTEKRTADFSLAYPSDSRIGPHQTVELDLAGLNQAQGWDTTGVDTTRALLKEAKVDIVLNPKTGETKSVELLVVTATDATGAKIYLDNDKNLTNGTFGVLNVADISKPIVDAFFIEEHVDSNLIGVKRRAFFRVVKAEGQKVSIYVSRPSYNNAQPASFRQKLDDANLVWPDYGLRVSNLTPEEYIESQAMIDRFLTDVADRFMGELGIDILLFYQPLVDSVGHKLQSQLPLPFDPANTDDVTRTFVMAYKIIDANLSRIFSKADRRRDVFAVMGDHGMDPVEKSVNFARFLPADHLDKVIVHTSGSLTLLYAKDDVAAARLVGAKAKEALQALRYEGREVLELAAENGVGNVPAGTSADFTKEWQYGDAVWAFSTQSGFWFQYKPLDQDQFSDPSAKGMHGQSLKVANMATRLVIKAPGVTPRHRIAKGSLLDAVPTFAHLMGINAPADCVGRSLAKELRKAD
jgi:hypothetical protein